MIASPTRAPPIHPAAGKTVEAIVTIETPVQPSANRPFRALADTDRDASLDAMLAGWDRASPVWVFGYGSLIWNPGFEFDRKVRGRVFGYHRSLCLWSKVYRGTPERPGLVLGLEPGGSVHGVAFRIPSDGAHTHLRALWQRELVTGSYVPRWLDVRLDPDEPGRVRAIGFVMDRRAAGYAGELDRRTLLDTVCGARGRNGSCADYLLSTVQSLAEHRIHDRHLARLAEEVGIEIALPRDPA